MRLGVTNKISVYTISSDAQVRVLCGMLLQVALFMSCFPDTHHFDLSMAR